MKPKIGPLRIAGDHYAELFGDESNLVLAAHDQYGDQVGDQVGGSENTYFSRFRSQTPLFDMQFHYTPYQGQTPWGQGIQSVGISGEIVGNKTKSSIGFDMLHTKYSQTAKNYTSYTTQITSTHSQFEGKLEMSVIRTTAMRPGYDRARDGYTSEYSVRLRFRPKLALLTTLNHDGLEVHLQFQIITTLPFTRPILDTFASTLTLSMDTLS